MNDKFQPFMGSRKSQTLRKNAVNLIGFPFDGTASFRKGAVLGPQAIRDVSEGIETYSPYLDLDLEQIANFFDLGDLEIKGKDEKAFLTANQAFRNLLSMRQMSLVDHDIRILALGGEHSISYCFIREALAAYPNLLLVHLDAHADLRDGYLGDHYSHASIIRRCLDHFGPEHELIQYGIRSGTKEEYAWMNEYHSLCHSKNELIEKLSLQDKSRPIYLTLDLDYFDPSFFPGTGTPEPGGEDFHSFVSLMKTLSKKNLIGADVVELAPNIDNTGNSSVFAAKVVRELILCMGSQIDDK
jgi:agmatinase